jgi:ankyrin repeat protein
MSMTHKLTAAEVLRRYKDEELPEFVELKLEDVNQRGNFGDRPIHVASIQGNVADVIALIEGGADVDLLGQLNFSALEYAATFGHLDIIGALLEHGASKSNRNDFGKSALDIAKANGFDEIAGLLDE